MISADDLFRPVTLEQAKQSILEVCEDLGLPTTAWRPKSVVRAMVWVVAALIAGVSVVVVYIGKAGLRQYATGSYLSLHAEQSVGISRIDATFAAGEVTLDNTLGGGLFNVAAGDLTVQNSSTLKTYKNDAAFTLIPGAELDVAITATESGSASSAGAAEIDTIVTTMLGVTCSNAAAVVGLDAESDDDLRDREGYQLDALSPNGPAGAYAAVAIAAVNEDGDLIGINRVRTNADSAVGEVTVTLATASGEVTGTVGNLSTDLGAVNQAIQTQCVPLGIASCTVQSASAVEIIVTYELWIYSTAGVDEDTAEDYASAALDYFITTRPIAGDVIAPATTGYIYHNLLEAAIKSMRSTLIDDETARTLSGYVVKVAVTSPAGDTALAATEVATAGAHVCTAVHLVAQ
jgi:phage-related baseplate assembly protein